MVDSDSIHVHDVQIWSTMVYNAYPVKTNIVIYALGSNHEKFDV